jgi:hypothetical protein
MDVSADPPLKSASRKHVKALYRIPGYAFGGLPNFTWGGGAALRLRTLLQRWPYESPMASQGHRRIPAPALSCLRQIVWHLKLAPTKLFTRRALRVVPSPAGGVAAIPHLYVLGLPICPAQKKALANTLKPCRADARAWA